MFHTLSLLSLSLRHLLLLTAIRWLPSSGRCLSAVFDAAEGPRYCWCLCQTEQVEQRQNNLSFFFFFDPPSNCDGTLDGVSLRAQRAGKGFWIHKFWRNRLKWLFHSSRFSLSGPDKKETVLIWRQTVCYGPNHSVNWQKQNKTEKKPTRMVSLTERYILEHIFLNVLIKVLKVNEERRSNQPVVNKTFWTSRIKGETTVGTDGRCSQYSRVIYYQVITTQFKVLFEQDSNKLVITL